MTKMFPFVDIKPLKLSKNAQDHCMLTGLTKILLENYQCELTLLNYWNITKNERVVIFKLFLIIF